MIRTQIPQHPETRGYLPCQLLLRDTSLGILEGYNYATLEHETWDVDPREVYAQIGQTSLRDMLFSPDSPGVTEKTRGVLRRVADTVPTLSYGSYREWMPRRRLVDPGSNDLPYYIIRDDVQVFYDSPVDSQLRAYFPSKVDWRGEVYLAFQHHVQTPGATTVEKIGISDDHRSPGKMPTVTSQIEVGDLIHESRERIAASEEEVLTFLGIVNSLRH